MEFGSGCLNGVLGIHLKVVNFHVVDAHIVKLVNGSDEQGLEDLPVEAGLLLLLGILNRKATQVHDTLVSLGLVA